jgi:hypothetical protein
MAVRMLTVEDQQELSGAFARVEAVETGEALHERYHKLAHDLAKG